MLLVCWSHFVWTVYLPVVFWTLTTGKFQQVFCCAFALMQCPATMTRLNTTEWYMENIHISHDVPWPWQSSANGFGIVLLVSEFTGFANQKMVTITGKGGNHPKYNSCKGPHTRNKRIRTNMVIQWPTSTSYFLSSFWTLAFFCVQH